jgi:hypothetical protein
MPVRVILAEATDLQYTESVNDIIADGTGVIVIGLVAVTASHPPTVTVFVTVYVPAALLAKLT